MPSRRNDRAERRNHEAHEGHEVPGRKGNHSSLLRDLRALRGHTLFKKWGQTNVRASLYGVVICLRKKRCVSPPMGSGSVALARRPRARERLRVPCIRLVVQPVFDTGDGATGRAGVGGGDEISRARHEETIRRSGERDGRRIRTAARGGSDDDVFDDVAAAAGKTVRDRAKIVFQTLEKERELRP